MTFWCDRDLEKSLESSENKKMGAIFPVSLNRSIFHSGIHIDTNNNQYPVKNIISDAEIISQNIDNNKIQGYFLLKHTIEINKQKKQYFYTLFSNLQTKEKYYFYKKEQKDSQENKKEEAPKSKIHSSEIDEYEQKLLPIPFYLQYSLSNLQLSPDSKTKYVDKSNEVYDGNFVQIKSKEYITGNSDSIKVTVFHNNKTLYVDRDQLLSLDTNNNRNLMTVTINDNTPVYIKQDGKTQFAKLKKDTYTLKEICNDSDYCKISINGKKINSYEKSGYVLYPLSHNSRIAWTENKKNTYAWQKNDDKSIEKKSRTEFLKAYFPRKQSDTPTSKYDNVFARFDKFYLKEFIKNFINKTISEEDYNKYINVKKIKKINNLFDVIKNKKKYTINAKNINLIDKLQFTYQQNSLIIYNPNNQTLIKNNLERAIDDMSNQDKIYFSFTENDDIYFQECDNKDFDFFYTFSLVVYNYYENYPNLYTRNNKKYSTNNNKMLIFKSQYSENYEELPFRIKETGEKHKNYSKLINVDLNLAEGTNVEAYIKKSDITECNITTQVIGNKSEDALSLYKNGEIVKHLANISSSKKFLINTTNKITELISKNNSFIPIIYEDKNYDINLKLIEDFDISIENNNTNNFVSVGSFIGHGTEKALKYNNDNPSNITFFDISLFREEDNNLDTGITNFVSYLPKATKDNEKEQSDIQKKVFTPTKDVLKQNAKTINALTQSNIPIEDILQKEEIASKIDITNLNVSYTPFPLKEPKDSKNINIPKFFTYKYTQTKVNKTTAYKIKPVSIRLLIYSTNLNNNDASNINIEGNNLFDNNKESLIFYASSSYRLEFNTLTKKLTPSNDNNEFSEIVSLLEKYMKSNRNYSDFKYLKTDKYGSLYQFYANLENIEFDNNYYVKADPNISDNQIVLPINQDSSITVYTEESFTSDIDFENPLLIEEDTVVDFDAKNANIIDTYKIPFYSIMIPEKGEYFISNPALPKKNLLEEKMTEFTLVDSSNDLFFNFANIKSTLKLKTDAENYQDFVSNYVDESKKEENKILIEKLRNAKYKHPFEFDSSKWDDALFSKLKIKFADENEKTKKKQEIKSKDFIKDFPANYKKPLTFYNPLVYLDLLEKAGLLFVDPYTREHWKQKPRYNGTNDPEYEFTTNVGFAPASENYDNDEFLKNLSLPINGTTYYFASLNCPYGNSNSYGNDWHYGIDLAANSDSPIISFINGKVWATTSCKGDVSDKNYNAGYGRMMIIKGDNDRLYLLGHLNGFSTNAKEGDSIHPGQIVAYAGTTGYSTGEHLHLEVFKCPGSIELTNRKNYLNEKYNKPHPQDKCGNDDLSLSKLVWADSWKTRINDRLDPLTGENKVKK